MAALYLQSSEQIVDGNADNKADRKNSKEGGQRSGLTRRTLQEWGGGRDDRVNELNWNTCEFIWTTEFGQLLTQI